jgi:ferredoxin
MGHIHFHTSTSSDRQHLIQLSKSNFARAERKPAKQITIDINLQKCVFCGICEAMCIFGAIKLCINERHEVPVFNVDAFPHLVKNIKIKANFSRCAVCSNCPPSKECPLGAFHMKLLPSIDPDCCACCSSCEQKCPNSVSIEKIFKGSIKINIEKCPSDCRECMYSCPVHAIYLDEREKISVDEGCCILCGACVNFCSKEAINITITGVNCNPVKSNIWDTTLKNLCSFKRIKESPHSVRGLTSANFPQYSKHETSKELGFERKEYFRKHVLTIDKDLCKKCKLCYLTCPKGAIRIINE